MGHRCRYICLPPFIIFIEQIDKQIMFNTVRTPSPFRSIIKKFLVCVFNLLTVIPVARGLFCRYVLSRFPYPDKKKIRAKIQYLAHCLDLHITTDLVIFPYQLRYLEHLLKEAVKQGIAFDETLKWALELSFCVRHGCKTVIAATAMDQIGNREDILSVKREGLETIIRSRRSVRNWDASREIDIEGILAIIDIAKWAPSSCNRQPWQTMIISISSDIEFVAKYFPNTFYKKAKVLIMVMMDNSVYGENEKGFAYLDAGTFIQNMLLLLHARGYGACWIGFKGWDCSGKVFVPQKHYDSFYRHFGISKDKVPVSMIALGWPYSGMLKAPPRQSIENIVINRVQAGQI